MRALVNSLKRLYEAGKLTKEQLKARVEKGTIDESEYEEITGETYEAGQVSMQSLARWQVLP